ncbi:MAG: hypothetical protein ACYTGN_01890 [Planctomycetota bacterium]|jgi:signal transduction histidine kinase
MFDMLLIVSAVLTVVVLLRRLRTVEIARGELRAELAKRRGVQEFDLETLSPSKIDPALAASEALAALGGLAFERDVRIHEMAEPCPLVVTFPALLAVSLRALVRTAIESAPEGVGEVTLAVGVFDSESAPSVGFAIADNGPGEESVDYGRIAAAAHLLGADLVIDRAPQAGTRATLKVPVAAPVPATTPGQAVVEAGD